MVAPDLTLPTLFSDDFESGVLDGWVGVGPGNIAITAVNPHAGAFALLVTAPVGGQTEYARMSSAFLVSYIALDVWLTAPNVASPPPTQYTSMGLADVAGNLLEITNNQLATPKLRYNGVNQDAGPLTGGGYHEFRFEYDYALDSVRWWVDNVDQGTVVGLGFGQPGEIRLIVFSDNFNPESQRFDDVVLSGNEDLLWKRRSAEWPWD